MRARNDVGQRLSIVQRGIVLFCILMLCAFIGILFSVSPKAYASTVHSSIGDVAARRKRTPTPLPTIPIILPTPTNTPIIPTPTPTAIVPTPTATPIPTPTMAPTNTPIPTATTGPKATPTAGVKPTATTAAGILPPGTTPTPTPPILTVTGTPSSSAGLPPGSTSVVSSPTTGTNTTYSSAAITTQDNGKMLLPTAPELAIGSSILGAAALMGWYLWRRRQGSLLTAGYPQAHMAQANIASSMPYAQTMQTSGTIGMVQEQGSPYQPNTTNQGMVPETPVPLQILMSNADTSLEAIMRQAHIGLFALPNQEEYS